MHPAQVAALLTSCLVLVRTANMSNDEAEAWLTIATKALMDVPADLLEEAITHAQRTCIHHARIVPAIWAYVQEPWNARKRRRFTLLEARRPEPPALPAPKWALEPGAIAKAHQDAAAQLRAHEQAARHGRLPMQEGERP